MTVWPEPTTMTGISKQSIVSQVSRHNKKYSASMRLQMHTPENTPGMGIAFQHIRMTGWRAKAAH